MQDILETKVSVVVASHRELTIENFVASFAKIMQDKLLTEIIIVADYIIDDYKKKYPEITWLYVPDKNIPIKRNEGIRAAKGEICAFIDDDCRPSEEWISEAVQFLDSHPDMAGVEGLTLIEDCGQKKGAYKEFKRLEKRGYRTNNIFYRRKILQDVNMFDERFAFQREDVDLAYSILESGFSIGYLPEIKVFHTFRKNEKWDLLKNCINRRFDPLLYSKHKKLYRQYIGTPYPPGIILIFMFYMISVAGMFLRPWYIYPLIIFNVIIIMLFTVRRYGLPAPADFIQWLREFVSFMVSPFVLFGALIHGSFRFRKIFLF